VETDLVKVGFGGAAGNKGAVVVRFNVFDSSICLMNCHLESGGNVQPRLQ